MGKQGLPDKLPAPATEKPKKIGTLHAKLNGKELLSCLVTAGWQNRQNYL